MMNLTWDLIDNIPDSESDEDVSDKNECRYSFLNQLNPLDTSYW